MLLRSSSVYTAIGDRALKPERGRLLIWSAMSCNFAWLQTDKSVPFRRYWLTNPFMFSLVVGHAVGHGLFNPEQLICKALEHVGRASRLGLWQLDQHHHAAGALNQGTHSVDVGCTLDQVALPVTRQ